MGRPSKVVGITAVNSLARATFFTQLIFGSVLLIVAAIELLAYSASPAHLVLWLSIGSGGAALIVAACLLVSGRLTARGLDRFATGSSRQGRALLSGGGEVMETDRGFERLTGLSERQAQGAALRDLLPESVWLTLLKRDQQQMLRRNQAKEATRVHRVGPIRLEPQHPGAPQRQLDCVFERQTGDQGEPCWLLTLQDISDRESAHQQRDDFAASQQHAIDASADWVLRLRSDGTVIHRNARAAVALGMEVQDFSACLGTTQPAFLKTLSAVEQTGEPMQHKLLRVQSPGAAVESGGNHLLANIQRLERTDGSRELLLTATDISALVEKQRRLTHRNARLETIYQHSPEAIALVRWDGAETIEMNPSFRALLGFTGEPMEPRDVSVLDLWVSNEERATALALLDETDSVVEYAARFRHQNGSERRLEINMQKIDLEGETHVLCMGRDIEEKALQGERLRASEEKFQRMFDGSPDGIAIVRLSDGVFVDINPSALRMLNYPRAALIGRSCFENEANPTDIEPRQALEELNDEAGFQNKRITLRTRQGMAVPALTSGTIITFDSERHLLLMVRDMRELDAVESRLQRLEARFRGAFENAQLALLLVDMDGRIFETNAYARDLLAFTEAQFDGLHISRLLPSEDRARLKSALGELQARGQGCIRSERRLQCQNGLEIWTNFQIVMQQGDGREHSYFIIQASDITDVKVTQRRMERMAFYDTLTDLANRRLFTDRLRQAIDHCRRHNRTSALLFLDLDQFKRVNDTLGHEAGDALLREVGRRLTESVRNEDTVGRMGGDEFTVLLYDVQHSGDAGVVASKILKALSQPMQISGHDLIVSASVGVTIIPDDGQSTEVLMKNADLAMYRAKERGRNNYQFFSSEMNAKASRALRIEQELRMGLERAEFELYHQPKYRLTDGALVGVESLVRWQHPERGLVSPGEFIDVAEETGAIIPLGSWIIEAACEAAKVFADLSLRDFETAVNLSPRQFRDPNLVNTIRRSLRTLGLAPQYLQIEITETMLMQDVSAAEITVARLHELGIQLAIDDFGTGYSSLNYLKRFPINTVKVDRSFVKDIPESQDDCAITAAVIAMAHRLQMAVVAEGVENDAQVAFLKDHGCEYVQGFKYGKPMTLEAMKLTIQRDNLRATPKVLVKG
ncbi:MAG: EAL domain-containing protein [Pseudomonadota bacterium]